MRISERKKEEIRDAVDIVEVIGRYVELKKRGSNYLGLSPFKQEKTPSFSVSPRLNIFKDFSSGIGGDVFKFLMEVEGWSFVKAAQFLAEMYHISLPKEDPEQEEKTRIKEKHREGLLHALEFATSFYTQQLYESTEAESGRKYIRTRKITKNALSNFRLGYAPKSGKALLEASQKAQINATYLEDAGLIKDTSPNGSKGAFDFFRGRIIFPIKDTNGRIIALAGRIVGKQKGPKYINSAESTVYHKSNVLYGLDSAKHEIRKQEECLLVEGYTDVIALWQNGITNVVASSGTALTEGQLQLIARYAKKLCMNYDGDIAGRNAMKRGIQLAFDSSLSVHILQLPESEDPDSFLNNYGPDAFIEYKNKNQTDFIRYIINEAKLTGKWSDPQGQSDTLQEILRILATIQDPLTKATSLNTLSEVSNIGSIILEERIALIQQENFEKQKRRDDFKRNESDPLETHFTDLGPYDDEANFHPVPLNSVNSVSNESPKQSAPLAEKEILRLLMSYGERAAIYIFEYLNTVHFSDQNAKLLFDAISDNYKNKKTFNDIEMGLNSRFSELVLEIFDEKERPSDLHAIKTGTHRTKDKDLFHSIRASIKLLAIKHLEREQARIATELNNAVEFETRKNLLNQKQIITKRRTSLEQSNMEQLFPIPESMPIEQKEEGFIYKPKRS